MQASTQAEVDARVLELLREVKVLVRPLCRTESRDDPACSEPTCGRCPDDVPLTRQEVKVRYLHLTPGERIDVREWTTKPAEWLAVCKETGADFVHAARAGRLVEGGANPDVCIDMSDRWIESYQSAKRKMFNMLIVSGQTGPDAKPLHPQWVRELRDQAVGASVAFFFAGHGDYVEWTGAQSPSPACRTPDLTPFVRVGAAASGRMLDGREWVETVEVK